MSSSVLRGLFNKWTPILQAPMAGTSSVEMAVAVGQSGGLGALPLGAKTPAQARDDIRRFRELSGNAPVNVNLFCHERKPRDIEKEKRWIESLAPIFSEFGKKPPAELSEPYQTFIDNEEMLQVLLDTRPAVVSFHFGLPSGLFIQALQDRGILLMCTVTNVQEACVAMEMGVDTLVAQGYEAGGHRGMFDPTALDPQLSTSVLVRLLRNNLPNHVDIIAAGGIMDGQGTAAALTNGATAVQMGTAFIACKESIASKAHQTALLKHRFGHQTVLTSAVSGRPARCLRNAFTEFGETMDCKEIPEYPIAYSAGKAVIEAAQVDETAKLNWGAHWAGQGASLAKTNMSAGQIVQQISDELRDTLNMRSYDFVA